MLKRNPLIFRATLGFTLGAMALPLGFSAPAQNAEDPAPPAFEEPLALEAVLRPERSGFALAQTENSSISLNSLFLYTLLVLGLGILVMKQPWFQAWAYRVRELQAAQPKANVYKTMWQAAQQHSPAPVMQPVQNALSPRHDWAEHLDTKVLPGGIKLHWVRLHGVAYILTETEKDSHWLALDEEGAPDFERSNESAGLDEALAAYHQNETLLT